MATAEATSPVQPFSLTLSTVLPLLIAFVSLALFYRPAFFQSKSRIYELPGISFITAWPFFTKRHHFLVENFKRTGQKMYQFHVRDLTVIAVRGEEGRKVFFNDKDLSMNEGYRILLGGTPRLDDIDIQKDAESSEAVIRLYSVVLNPERIAQILPLMAKDIHTRMETWGKRGRINPAEHIFNLVFHITIRMATCAELADDLQAVDHLTEQYALLESASAPERFLFPWFPTAAKRNHQKATQELYMMLMKHIHLRKNAAVASADCIDTLLQIGMPENNVIEFIMGMIFAGFVNTGRITCWALIYLCGAPKWQGEISAEVRAIMDKYTDSTSSAPLHERWSSIPIKAIEDEMPILDSVVRETIRLLLVDGTPLRRNVVRDLEINGKVVPKGAFLAYNMADAHLDENIYPEPEKFDPSRYEAGHEQDKKGVMAFLGWGAGRHVCPGMKIAKLEVKTIVAMFIAGFDYKLVDASGKFPDPFPQPDHAKASEATPVGNPCFFDFERVAE